MSEALTLFGKKVRMKIDRSGTLLPPLSLPHQQGNLIDQVTELGHNT